MRYLRTLFLLFIFIGAFFEPLYAQLDLINEEEEEEVYLAFRYRGVIDEIVVAYYANDRFYLPLTEIFEYCGIQYDLDPGTLHITGTYITEDRPYYIDLATRIALYQDKSKVISVDDFLIKELDYYFTPALFEQIFQLKLSIDLSRLSLRLETDDELPIVVRYETRQREELRKLFDSKTEQDQYDLLLGREWERYDGVLLDYSLNSALSESRKSTTLNLSMGGELLAGDIQGKLISSVIQSETDLSFSDVRWRYYDDSRPWFSTLTLGQQSSTGLVDRTFQGLRLSNTPLIPERSYDTYIIDGTTDADAEVELFQDNRLVDITRADEVGYYRFEVPLNYGNSDFKIRIYAKQGNIIELDRKVLIPFHFLPVGKTRYDISLGRLASETFTWGEQANLSQANISRGINNWLTTGVGLEYIQDQNQDKPVFYSKVSSRLARDILVGIDAAFGSYYRLNTSGIGSNGSTVAMDYTYYAQQSLYNTIGYLHNFNANIFYPIQFNSLRLTTRAAGGWSKLQDKDNLNLLIDIQQLIRGVRFRYGLREQHTFSTAGHTNTSQLLLGAVYTIPRIRSIHKLLRGSYFRGDLSLSTTMGELNDFRFLYIKQFSNRLKIQFQTTYDFIQKSSFFEIGMNWDLPALRSTTTLRSIRSTPSLVQSIRGSVGLDRTNSEYLWDSRQQVGRSGVNIRMFIDENGSGTYDEGEEIIPGSAVSIEGASSRRVIKSGIPRLTQLQPYRRYNFYVNESRIKNPMLVPLKRKFSVVTDPNQYKQVDVPFYTTGIVDGRVDAIRAGQLVPMGGLRVHITGTDNSYSESMRTFGDGSFYSMEVPPGEYELRIDKAQLQFLGKVSRPDFLTFRILADPEGDYVEGLNFILEEGALNNKLGADSDLE